MAKSTLVLSATAAQIKNGNLLEASRQFKIMGLDGILADKSLPAPSSKSPIRVTFTGKDNTKRSLLVNDTHAVHQSRNQADATDKATFDLIWDTLAANPQQAVGISEDAYEVESVKLPSRVHTGATQPLKVVQI